MSNVFFLANDFADENLHVDHRSNFAKFTIVGSFKFRKILMGDKCVWFVCSTTNKLVQLFRDGVPHTRRTGHVESEEQVTLYQEATNMEPSVLEVKLARYKHLMDCHVFDVEYSIGINFVYMLNQKQRKLGILKLYTNDPIRIIEYSSEIKRFYSAPLSSNYVVITNDGRVFHNEVEQTDMKGKIVKATCCGSGSILASRNQLFATGDNTFSAFGDQFSKLSTFCLISTFESPIKQVICGYFHTIVLLENNELYGCGYNVLHQSSFSNTQEVQRFTKIDQDFGFIEEIGCSSRGTWVKNINNDVFMVGEVVQHFHNSILSNNPKIIKFNIENEHHCNSITGGGWQYILFHQNDKTEGKRIRMMFENLKQLTHSCALSDIAFNFDE